MLLRGRSEAAYTVFCEPCYFFVAYCPTAIEHTYTATVRMTHPFFRVKHLFASEKKVLTAPRTMAVQVKQKNAAFKTQANRLFSGTTAGFDKIALNVRACFSFNSCGC